MKKIFTLYLIYLTTMGTSLSVQAQSEYWFPKGIDSSMLTDSQMAKYRIVDMNKYRKSTNYVFSNSIPFIEHKVKEAKAQGRQVIQGDLLDANNDYKILKNISLSLNDGLSQETSGEAYGGLTQDQEIQLNRIINEYGTAVLDDELKRKLKRYKQRQVYMRNNNSNENDRQSKAIHTDTELPKPLDRYEFHRIYDGIDYESSKYATPTKNNIMQGVVNTLTNSVYGLIND